MSIFPVRSRLGTGYESKGRVLSEWIALLADDRRWPLKRLVLLSLLMACSASIALGTDIDLRAALDNAREVSYTQSWRDAQVLLDELAPLIDQADVREFTDFHLLEARHLALQDRSDEALNRADMLLDLDLEADQLLQVRQFSANIAVLLRDYELAFDHLLNALMLESELDDPAAALGTYNMASYLFGRVDEHDQAIEYGERALALAQVSDDPNEACIARQRLSPVFKWAGMTERAEAEYREAIRVCLAVGNRLFAGVLQHGLADLLRREGRPEEAVAFAAEAVDALTDSGFVLGEFEARLARVEAEFDLGLTSPERDDEFGVLQAYFNERRLWDQLARLEALLARRAESRGDPDQALIHLRAYFDAREQFLGRDRAMRLAYLQVAFGLRLKEQQIDLLEENARLSRIEAETAAQQRRARSIILLLSLLLAAALAIALARAFRARRHFQNLARHDRLSGLANHGWFFERAEELLNESEKTGRPLFLVIADIDRFKAVNDRYGHHVGDQVLGQVSRRLREVFPEALVGRIGGEEFGVLLTATDVNSVVHDVEQFRRTAPSSTRAGDPAVTVSFGIAAFQRGDTLDVLRERADKALYQAKVAGRDRYIVASASHQADR